MEEELIMYTIEDVMKIFRIGRNKAYNLCKTKGFPAIKKGAKTLIPKIQLMKWIKENLECEIYLP